MRLVLSDVTAYEWGRRECTLEIVSADLVHVGDPELGMRSRDWPTSDKHSFIDPRWGLVQDDSLTPDLHALNQCADR